MSFSAVRPFFRTQMEALGFEEHEDSVDFENVPSTALNNKFQLNTETATGSPTVQTAHSFDYNITMRVFLRSIGRQNSATFDEADVLVDRVFGRLLDASVRVGTTIKDIVPNSVSKTALSSSNDNDLVIEFGFTVRLLNCYFNP